VTWTRKHFLDIQSLSAEEIIFALDTAKQFKAVGERAIKKVPDLRGKTVINLFVEPSTRTRLSFELAAQRPTADVIKFLAEALSLKKGETLKDKVQQNADQLKRNQWVTPVSGYRLTATFGQRSGLWSSGYHTGLDFAGPSGSTIVSVARGTVKSVGYGGAYGNRTVITLEDGTDVWYCHQSRIGVTPGEQVDPGQIIGFTGSTGNVTGPRSIVRAPLITASCCARNSSISS
jgi:murein DD-endopeptidase MepM/ murein hydrolase activator NlpD